MKEHIKYRVHAIFSGSIPLDEYKVGWLRGHLGVESVLTVNVGPAPDTVDAAAGNGLANNAFRVFWAKGKGPVEPFSPESQELKPRVVTPESPLYVEAPFDLLNSHYLFGYQYKIGLAFCPPKPSSGPFSITVLITESDPEGVERIVGRATAITPEEAQELGISWMGDRNNRLIPNLLSPQRGRFKR